MTDRIRQLTVVLDGDYRDDDVEAIVQTIKMIRGVSIVEQHVVTAQDQITRMAVRSELARDLHKAIDDVFHRKADRKDS